MTSGFFSREKCEAPECEAFFLTVVLPLGPSRWGFPATFCIQPRRLRNSAQIRWKLRVAKILMSCVAFRQSPPDWDYHSASSSMTWYLRCMSTHCLPFRVTFACTGKDWKKRFGGQAMLGHRGMKLASIWASIGASRLPIWTPKDDDRRWTEMPTVKIHKQNPWHECCAVCLMNSRPSKNWKKHQNTVENAKKYLSCAVAFYCDPSLSSRTDLQ